MTLTLPRICAMTSGRFWSCIHRVLISHAPGAQLQEDTLRCQAKGTCMTAPVGMQISLTAEPALLLWLLQSALTPCCLDFD